MERYFQIIIKLKANNGSNTTEINLNEGSRLSDPIQIANSSSSYFTNVAVEVTKKIPLPPKSPINYLGPVNTIPFSYEDGMDMFCFGLTSTL